MRDFGCWHTTLKKKDNGYYKIDRAFLKEFLPQEIFDILVKRGIYENGEDSAYESDVYIHRFILALFYIIVGLQSHHLFKNLAQNCINHLNPIKSGLHQKIDNMNYAEGIEKSLEIEKEEQIKQFAEEEERKLKSRNRVQNRESTIKKILELSVNGMNPNEIAQAIGCRICDKKVREYINLFPLAEEFLEYLESQDNQEFSDLYSNIDEKWQYLINWEKRKNKNITEFLASKMGKDVISSDSVFTPIKRKINQENCYGLNKGDLY